MKFTKSHEWIEKAGELYRIGVTDYAQEHLSDIVYVEAEEEGVTVEKGERLGTLESVKAAEDFLSPVDVEVKSFNEELTDAPELVNSAAQTDGWIVEVIVTNESQLDELMNEEEYKEFLKTL